MTFGVTYKVKGNFFDRKLVQQEQGKESAKVLSKFGAFVRRRARSSQRRRKAASAPGQPPSAHSKDAVATLKNILFAYDRRNQSVVIGPVLLNGSRGSVPALHEFGGTMPITEALEAAKFDRKNPNASPVEWRPVGKRFRPRPGQKVRTRTATWPARPFMGPAMLAELPKFSGLFASTARGVAA
jgi:hypothetical protein